uniref:Uncharacterized protein n=1 Tax=viral metagenome TaxID=1070528 RepID=A0A6M3IHY4_9ZZZZ
MALTSEKVAHSVLVGGGQTALHSHAGGGGGLVSYYAESPGDDSSNSTSWQTKLSLLVEEAGDYLVQWTYELRGSSTTYHRRSRVVHASFGETELANAQMEPRDNAPVEWMACSGFRKVTLAVNDTIRIDYCSENATGTAYIRYAAICIIKL